MGTYKYDERETSHRKYFFQCEFFTARTKRKLEKFIMMRAGFQSGPLNSTPVGPRGAKKSARLFLLNTHSQVRQAVSDFLHLT